MVALGLGVWVAVLAGVVITVGIIEPVMVVVAVVVMLVGVRQGAPSFLVMVVVHAQTPSAYPNRILPVHAGVIWPGTSFVFRFRGRGEEKPELVLVPFDGGSGATVPK